jgi:hypothetical protein
MKRIFTVAGKVGTVIIFRQDRTWKNRFRNVGAYVLDSNRTRYDVKPTRSLSGMIRRLRRLGFIENAEKAA